MLRVRLTRETNLRWLLRLVAIALAFGAGSLHTVPGSPAPVTYSACRVGISRLKFLYLDALKDGTCGNHMEIHR